MGAGLLTNRTPPPRVLGNRFLIRLLLIFVFEVGNSYQNHPALARSRTVHLRSVASISSSAEARILMTITGHRPTPPVGSTHYHRQRTSPNHCCTHQEARPHLFIRRLLTHVPSGIKKFRL
ncbi:hypothetical protein AVEN_134909-1 [Araneus ventricosus]|uniref:Secreted protein n=1 Tax=Araneus ventricosus TaxID=182803 RepID=A0A4Y2CGZ4_ARAVE|nr:hypothetical protein AVEN_134909-1 [Araneus ventricosus]